MEEQGLKLWEVFKLFNDGAYIKGDIFRNKKGEMITYYDDGFVFGLRVYDLNDEYFYYGNQYEVMK